MPNGPQLRRALQLLGGLLPRPVFKAAVRALHRVPVIRLGERELRLLRHLVPRHRQAVDVGAHKGLYSIILEGLVGAERLFAFEPVPDLYHRLCTLLPSAHLFPVALSSRAGNAVLSIPCVGRAAQSSRATLEGNAGSTGPALTHTVPTARLDEYLESGLLYDVGFIKIDVEGHELEVLRGATSVLATHRPRILVEIEQRHHNYPIERVFGFLYDQTYKIFFLPPGSRRLVGARFFDPGKHQQLAVHGTASYVNNFVCLPANEELGVNIPAT